MTEDLKLKKFLDYKTRLSRYISEESVEKLIDILGGPEKVMNAPYDNTIISGCAYDGSFIENIMKLTSYAVKINDLIPAEFKAKKESIVKVGLLSQVSKVIMFEENDNSWEKTNRGIVYKYTELEGALRVGERSLYLLMNLGIELTPSEYEAFKILDKNYDDDPYIKLHSTTLSLVIKQASEILYITNRKPGR